MRTDGVKSEGVGRVIRLVRYPIKSMAGVELPSTAVGWHGLVGDRRLAVRRLNESGDFPWLTASRLPSLLLYQPRDFNGDALPKCVRTPHGKLLDVHGEELREEIGAATGHPVELMALKHGIFDEAVISMIDTATASAVCHEAGVPVDHRRFRANIEFESGQAVPFGEDEWVGKIVTFGEGRQGPAVLVTKRDVRCAMIGLDPDTAAASPEVLKTAVRLNDNHAGVYATVIRTGSVRVGDAIHLQETPPGAPPPTRVSG